MDIEAYRFGPFELLVGEQILTRGGERVPLSPKAFDLLRLLVECGGRVVGKRALLDALWPDTFVEEANLSVQVAAVRKALGRLDEGPPIETIAKRGYRFVARVEPVRGGRAGTALSHPVVRLQVLPLRVTSPSPDTAFLSFSLPDAIAGTLSDVNWLAVSSPVRARRERAGFAGPRAASGAAADAVLEGTLGAMGGETWVQMTLVAPASGTVLFSDRFAVRLAEIFDLQVRVAQEVIRALAPRSDARLEPRRPSLSGPSNPGAYVFYLRANQLAYETSQWSASRELYEASLAEDPDYAPAWARLARCHRVIGKFSASQDETRASFGRAEAAFQRALELDPELSITHNLYAQLEVDLGRAEEAMRRLVARARRFPNDAELFSGLVHALRFCGLLEASIAAHHRARALDATVPTSVHHTWWMMGEYERALGETYGDIGYMPGLALAMLGREREAIAVLRWRERENQDSRIGPYLASLRALLEGRREESLRALAQASAVQLDPEALYYLARTYARLGDQDNALAQMTRVVGGRFCCADTFTRDPWLAPLAGDPRLVRLVDEARRASVAASQTFVVSGGERLLGCGAG